MTHDAGATPRAAAGHTQRGEAARLCATTLARCGGASEFFDDSEGGSDQGGVHICLCGPTLPGCKHIGPAGALGPYRRAGGLRPTRAARGTLVVGRHPAVCVRRLVASNPCANARGFAL